MPAGEIRFYLPRIDSYPYCAIPLDPGITDSFRASGILALRRKPLQELPDPLAAQMFLFWILTLSSWMLKSVQRASPIGLINEARFSIFDHKGSLSSLCMKNALNTPEGEKKIKTQIKGCRILDGFISNSFSNNSVLGFNLYHVNTVVTPAVRIPAKPMLW